MSDLDERQISIVSGDLRLEAAIHDGDGTLAALVLHPHPQYGGDMDNHVVTSICGVFAARGATTLRVNFRGVGQSDGSYDNGRAEAADARAALAALREAAPEARIVLAGYSFGAMIAAAVAADAGLAGLLLVSPPLGVGSLAPLGAALPTLVLAGDRDQVAPAEAIRALAGPNRRAVVVEGVDHSWWPGLESLVTEVNSFAASLPVQGATP
jgi:hypothetical protein